MGFIRLFECRISANTRLVELRWCDVIMPKVSKNDPEIAPIIPVHNDTHLPPPHPEVANTGVPVLGIKSATSGTPDVDAKRSLEGRIACTGSSFEAR